MHWRNLLGQGLLVSAIVAAFVAPCLDAQQLTDSAFHAMQARGKEVMGVDQMTSMHRFTPLPDGGRITFVRDSNDSAGTARIRAHLRKMQGAFSAGDFSMPMLIHMKIVPGVSVMAARHNLITYTETDIPRGGQLRIVTEDSASIAAVHEFLAFQRGEHRAGS
jgi:hypothetical protein